ncbi:MAG: asparagine synthase (glutamine-hydrolyzing) [Myxococcales bacterium]|nr:asparagine synthase (glutamine-hydrolyzing) [Myxococcales bacterium]
MCGIAGIVALDPRAQPSAERLVRMRDALAHRGPDGAGTWIEGPVGLAHRRLAIVDVAAGAQPMSNEDGRVWIAFNGEIYNHAALRPALERRGHRYRTRSDTETIVHLYEEHGPRCVERLQGMFAFALWDCARERLLLARDRLGIKPLYYALTADELLFASEVKALVAAGVGVALADEVLPEFLASGFVAGEQTLFRGVKKLLPGRILTWTRAHGVEEARYWRPPTRTDARPTEPLAVAARDLRARLAACVKSHLMSDVPLGVFLSGGLDSTGIAALAAREVTGKLNTFSVGFDAPEGNELSYARLAADAIGTEHREVVVSPAEFKAALPRLVWHEDEPLAFPSSVPLYFVSRLARDHVKVVLTGEGADELFLGYNRYRVTAWNRRLGALYWGATPGWLRRAVARAAPALSGPGRRWVRRSFLVLEPSARSLFCENFAVFPSEQQAELLVDGRLLAARDPFAASLRAFAAADGDELDAMSRADLETYLVELLMKQDQMSMAASVESRVPFLDHELVEHAMQIPSGLKLRGLRTKAVLRAALADVVPRAILTRPKWGFPVPLARWMRGPFRPFVHELVLSPRARARGLFRDAALRALVAEHESGRRDHSARLWLLSGLELWHRLFVDGEAPALVAERSFAAAA